MASKEDMEDKTDKKRQDRAFHEARKGEEWRGRGVGGWQGEQGGR